MGADFYIEPTHEMNRKAFEPIWREVVAKRDASENPAEDGTQAEVERVYGLMNSAETYFRSSYNCFGVLIAFDIDVYEACNKQQIISKRNARKLAEQVKALPLKCNQFEPRYWLHASWGEPGRDVTREIFEQEIKPWFFECRDAFVRFLLSYANDPNPKLKLRASL